MVSELEVLPGITAKRVKQFRSLRGTWRYFGCESKAEFEAKGVTDLEVAEYIQAKASQRDFIENESKRASRGGKIDASAFNAMWDKKFAEYQSRFTTEDATPNDIASLRRLAFMDAQQEFTQQHIVNNLTLRDISDRNAIKGLNETLVSLSREMREIEKTLGIDRVTRKKDDDVADPMEVIASGIRDARWLLANEIQEVRCPGCESKHDVAIMSIWHRYPTHPHGDFTQECPNCGRILVVKCKKRGVAAKAKDFEIPDLLRLGRP